MRKYQCFCCGVAFSEENAYEEFKAHIIEKHEEGRDYIICPVTWCKTPIRDIRSHFKIRHPTLEIPKITQNKAIVWKDTREKKVRVRKPKYREGYFLSQKNGGKEYFYRSGMESQVFELLEQSDKVSKFDYEPFKIEYWFDGEHHNYIPDVSVLYTDGSIELWEIKPLTQTDLPKNKAKWIAAENFCKSRGWNFVVLTEMGINKLRNSLLKG